MNDCAVVSVAPFCLLDHHCAHQVAQPSLNQISRQVAGPTLSPNHWCAISCASVPMLIEPPPKCDLVWDSSA